MTTRLADLLHTLSTPDADTTGPPLCLATGPLGPALLHLMHDPDTAHPWIQAATTDGLDPDDRATLFYGLPALACVLSYAPQDRYMRDRAILTSHLNALTQHRLRVAHHRIDQRRMPSYGEYDLISGLTGIGVALMRTDPHGTALEQVLTYLVRLTEPLRTDDGWLPGWWVHHDPRMGHSSAFPRGHMNLGMAHGISGVLALLALNHRKGRHVPGHEDAMRRLCATLDTWQRTDRYGPWWPGWTTVPRPDSSPQPLTRPGPPSWCYGTPGPARAQQLAGLALEDTDSQRTAERALLACVRRSARQPQKADHGLCHGRAGLLQTLRRAAHDQQPAIGTEPLSDSIREVHARSVADDVPISEEPGLLEGQAGLALALLNTPRPAHLWDTLLLLDA
ncbi:lanthionine synthetase C family protein [Nocardiopsis sp. CA-288880]|uniref:lanthionine synthetase C family protein n=1 Tax=Nocardiopsis sp. CA-288880 TaxID=3239995 RepID=UPI003D98A55D